uniref:Uncharacterized protein n=1 Tax=Arundo donax TaxID=35708 RepID=A0A0A8Z8Y6_ARUDO
MTTLHRQNDLYGWCHPEILEEAKQEILDGLLSNKECYEENSWNNQWCTRVFPELVEEHCTICGLHISTSLRPAHPC